MASITQDMRYRLSLIRFAEKYGVSKAAIKYKTNRQYIYRWKRRYDGTIESLRDRSRRPHHHPNQHTPEEIKLICPSKTTVPEDKTAALEQVASISLAICVDNKIILSTANSERRL